VKRIRLSRARGKLVIVSDVEYFRMHDPRQPDQRASRRRRLGGDQKRQGPRAATPRRSPEYTSRCRSGQALLKRAVVTDAERGAHDHECFLAQYPEGHPVQLARTRVDARIAAHAALR
jgi:hypothetical protein